MYSIDCTHIHPGYGFLSESPVLAAECVKVVPPIAFIGPSIETLRIASDKMLSRELASSANVNIAAGTRVSTSDDVRAFVAKVGYPVMIKALDGGGGRGIRVVEQENTLEESFKRSAHIILRGSMMADADILGAWANPHLINCSSRKL